MRASPGRRSARQLADFGHEPHGVENKPDSRPEAAAHLLNLQDKVDEAARLIAELRESNQALRSELDELKARSGEEIEILRAERGRIRGKLESLLDRVEGLES